MNGEITLALENISVMEIYIINVNEIHHGFIETKTNSKEKTLEKARDKY